MSVDGLEVDLAARVVRRDGEPVHLTPTEFELLRMLVRERGRLLTHRMLLREVWGPSYEDDTRCCACTSPTCAASSSPTPPGRATSPRIRAWGTASRPSGLHEICIRGPPFLHAALTGPGPGSMHGLDLDRRGAGCLRRGLSAGRPAGAGVSATEVLGLVVSLAPARLPGLRAAARGEALMTARAGRRSRSTASC